MEKPTNNQSFPNINSLLKPYLSNWYWFIISIIICVLIGIVFIKVSVPVYNIKSAVLIKDAKKSLGGAVASAGILDGLSGFGGMSTNSIENELEVFKSKKLVRDVVKSKNLQTSFFTVDNLTKKELFGDTSPINIIVVNEKKNKKFPKKPFLLSFAGKKLILESSEYNYKKEVDYNRLLSLPFANVFITKNNSFDKEKAEDIGNTLEVNFSTVEGAASNIQKMIDVDLADKDATVINLSINSSQVDKAIAVINDLIFSYNKDAILDKNTESQKTKEFIDSRIEKISKELGNVESEKERFKTDNRISDILTETKINLESSAEAKKKELELDGQLELTDNLIIYLQKQNTNVLLPNNIGLNNSESNNAIASYNKMILDRNRMLENATVQNPLVIDITKQINSMKKSVEESLLKNKLGLQLALNEYTSEQNKINSRIIKVPAQEKIFRNLERQQQIKESLYLLLLQKREETAISLAVVAPKARTVEPAFVSDKPVSPKKLIILVMSLIFGTLLPFFVIYIRQLLNTKIIYKNDLKELSQIPIVAEIPSGSKNVDNLVKSNDFTALAEAFRILVTNMNFMLDSNSASKIIFVTSSVKGEGKTFVSMNLALSLANSNKVIIIGADIRNPQLQRYQKNKTHINGLTEFLYDPSVQEENIIHKNPVSDNCDIIYSGTIPPNPTELLKNGRIAVLLNYLRTKYQYIIIDTAPLLLVTDTFIIAQFADLELYVTRSNYTERSLIEFVNENVQMGKLKNVALVLNDVKKENVGYGNKYGYGYNNK